MKEKGLNELKRYAIIIIGAFIFALGINIFIVPVDLYNGGIVGIAQIIRTILNKYLSLPSGFDISGIINFMINIPLLIIAYMKISKKFFSRTLASVLFQTIFFSIIKVPVVPIISDILSACLVGGIITAIGMGITLRAGGSGGGIDIIAIYLTKKMENFSVGKLAIMVNVVVYGLCAIMFELPTAIYSIMYTGFYSIFVDKIHYQNINTTAMIITKEKEIENKILSEMGRGVTCWNGSGAYTRDHEEILMTVISKYEISQLKRIVLEKDPKAFIIFNEGLNVTGNFEKRL